MNGTAARHEAAKILAELPDRISDVIKPFAHHSPDHPALVQGDVTWTYGDLAAIVARTAITLSDYGIRPGDRVMIVSENSLALAAILLAASEQTLPEPVERDRTRQVAALLYTSGTTGNPKGVMLTHRNVLFSARVVGSLRGVTPADRAYCVLPMSHIVGYSAILIASLTFGCTVQIVSRYDPR